jgi:tetratricopeptide (TPR) repeat protein
VWIEAARSFHQALRLDPDLAMAWIGLSRVHSGLDDTTGARRALDRARALAPKLGEREKRRIEIREKQLAAIAALEDPAPFNAYKKAIDDALARDLDDLQLWLLRGNAEEPTASGRGQRGSAASIAFYEQVLRRVPDHATAHHFLVHTYETIGQVDQALEHGAAYARLAPAIPHAAHMWAHDLRRVGRVDEAIEQFVLADRLEREYYAAEKLDPALDWHHGHNLDLLAACYQHKGQMDLAEKTMRDCAKLAPVDAYRAFNAKELPHFLLHRARYDEALAEARALTEGLHPQARCVGHALAGQALLEKGRVAAAETELDAARRELTLVPKVTLNLVPRRSVLEPWVEGLRGELLLRTGNKEEARTVLEGVIRGLRATPGPDAWVQALFRMESIGRSARQAGDWDLAAFVASQMMEHDPAYGGTHLAQALVLRQRGDRAGHAREIELARRYWKDADSKLAERKLLAAASR